MATPREWVIRLWGTLRPGRQDAELEEELRLHLEMAAEHERRPADSTEDAKRAAVIRIGSIAQSMEALRDQRGLPWLDDLARDLRHGLRVLRRNPAYTAIIVLVLALGIGANTLIFSMINVVVLMRFPYSNAERLVLVQTIDLEGTPEPVAPANFVDWRREARSFEYLSAKLDWIAYDLTGPEGPQQVIGVPVTAGIFEMLGVRPQLGRTFGPGDDRAESERVAILSDRLWTIRYKRDSGILGRTIMVRNTSYTVIGVMPPGFYVNRDVTIPANVDQLWVPYASQVGIGTEGMSRRNMSNLRVWGKLKPGVTLEQAQAEMNVINARLQQAYPDTNAGRGVAVSPLSEFRADRLKRAGDVLMMLMGAVSFVLLIACANVANLQLARAAAQQRDLAIRTALGASRLRIVQQLMTEMLILALVGGAASLLVAWWAQQLLMTFLPENLPVPRLDRLTLDGPVVLFALGAAMLSGIVAGLVPAARLSSGEGTGRTNDVLKAAGRGLTGDRGDRRLRNTLVMSEVAVAMILLVGAGLLIRSLLLLQQTEPGFDPTNVLTVRIPAPDRPPITSEQEKQRDVVVTAMLQRIQGLPRVESVAMVQGLPTVGIIYPDGIILEQDPTGKATAIGRVVSADYFRVMRIPLKAGRLLSPSDTASSPRVVVIDETLAARYFSNTNPIGQRLRWEGQERSTPFATIVGVVGAVRDTSIRDELSPEIYESYLQVNSHPVDWTQTALVIRGPHATALATPVRSEIAAVSPNQPIPQIQSMEQVLRSSLAAERFNALLLTGLAALALILAAAGIYGVISYSVAQRTHEIGLRMALGAEPGQVLRNVVRQGLTTVVAGILVGTVGAVFLTRLMVGLLHGVSPTDSITFGLVGLVLTGVAVVASYVPARRAMRVDPLTALREE